MATTYGEQTEIRCVQLRGGTSKGLYLRPEDLPPEGPARDGLLSRLEGAPDVLEIDGLGGSRPITSKIGIVSKSTRKDADVDYTFAQVDINSNVVIYSANCGNISSGVGPFAIDEGIVKATEGMTQVRIYNTNTHSVIIAQVPVKDGKAAVDGDYSVPGIPGTGAEIAMNWAGTVGAKTGKLLPTGNPTDKIKLESGKEIEISIVDAANPMVFGHAEDFGISGSELVDAINNNTDFINLVKEVRGKGAALIGMCKDWKQVDTESPGLPIFAALAAPADYKTINGDTAKASDLDARVRVVFMNQLHESVPGTGSICLTAASRVKDSVVEKVSAKRDAAKFLIGHPSGVTPGRVKSSETKDAPFVHFDELGFSRTARRLMSCTALIPTSLMNKLDQLGTKTEKSNKGVVHEG